MKQTAVEWLCERLALKLGVPMAISFYIDHAQEIEQAKKMEKEQNQDTWETAHQAGRFEGKGIAEEKWQTFEPYWKETFRSE